MNTKTYKKMKLFTLVLAMVVLSIMPICLLFSSNKVDFVNAESDVSSQIITNNNFDSSSSSSLQTSPNGWTALGDNSKSIKKGVITVEETAFSNYKTSYGLTASQNPGKSGTAGSDSKVLMINAQSSYSKSYFQTANDINLDNDSFYLLSVYTKVLPSSISSIYLDGLFEKDSDYDDTNSFIEVNFQQWTKLTFLIKTGIQSKTTKLSLYLGSKTTTSTSAAFFDGVEFYKMSEKSYDSFKSNNIIENEGKSGKQITYKEINLQNENVVDISDKISNNNFNNPLIPVLTQVRDANGSFVDVENSKYSNLSLNNSFAFSIKNSTPSYSTYKIDNIVIPQYGIYEISIDAKIIESLSSGSATIKIIEKDDVKDIISSYIPKNSSLQINSEINAVKNNFNTYSFFIKSNSLCDTSVALELWIGDEETNNQVTGEVAFDNLVIRSTVSEVYDAKTASSFTQVIDLSTSTTIPTIKNGHFNIIDYKTPVGFDSSLNPVYSFPFEISEWTYTSDENADETKVTCGVLNTKSTLYNASAIGTANPQNPSYNIVGESLEPNSNSNNILMLKNSISSYQAITKTALSLSASTTYQFSLDVKTILDSGVSSISIMNGSKTIASFSNIDTNGSWKNYKIIIKTNTTALTLSAKYELGTKESGSVGYAFIDNVRLNTPSFTETAFANLYSQPNTKVVDFVDGNWSIVKETPNEFEVYELLTGSKSLAEGAYAGAINGTTNPFEVTSSKSGINNNMLLICNTQQGSSTLTTDKIINLTAKTYYKISVDIQTQRLQALSSDSNTNYGVSLKLSSFDTTLSNIVSSDKFTTYSFFIYPSENADLSLIIKLESPTHQTLGTAIIDNLVVEDITSVDYEEMETKQSTSSPLSNVAVVETATTDNSTETETTDDQSSSNGLTNDEIWLLIPSIIFGIVVIFAIVAFILRKVKIKKIAKFAQSSYDRTTTLERETAKIQAKKNIDALIAEQNELLKIVEGELKELEDKYQKDLQSFRDSHDQTKSAKMEKEFKLYLNKKSGYESNIASINQKIKSYENPELLILEEKKLLTAKEKENARVKRHIKRETKKIKKNKNGK